MRSIATNLNCEKTYPRFVRNWIERVYVSLSGRPLVYALLMCLSGSYLGYFFPLYVQVLVFSLGIIGSSVAFFVFSSRTGTILTILSGLILFALCTMFFCQYAAKAAGLPEEEHYEGHCYVRSRNGNSDGYKNLTIKLETGETVAWLTDSQHEFGEELTISGTISTIRSKGNPGDSDYKGLFNNSGIFRSIKVDKVIEEKRSGFSLINACFRLGDRIRRGCFDMWNRYTDKTTAAFLSAMVVGDTAHLDDEVKDQYKDSNLYHLLVVSGAHVGYFTATIAAVFSLLSHNRKARIIVLSVSLLFFGFVIGWSSSATRSILTFLCVSFLSLENRCVDRLSACAFSALILLLSNPFSIFSTGLLLSFGATFSILLFEKRMTGILKRICRHFPEELVRALSCYLCASLGMMPVLLKIGNTQSVTKLLVVIFAGFPAELICSLGFLLTILAFLLPFSGLRLVMFFPLRGLVMLLDMLSAWGQTKSAFHISLHNLSMAGLALLVSILLLFVCKNGIKKRIVVAVFSVSFVTNLVNILLRPVDSGAKVYFLDVGQGDCALICCHDRAFLVDGGNFGSSEKILSAMNYLDIEKIDMAFASHLDSDHIGGLIELYQKDRIHSLYTPFWDESSEMTQLQETCHDLPESAILLTSGSSIKLGEGMKFHVVWPSQTTDGGNEDSMVIWAEILGTNILFTGDIGEETEEKIIGLIPETIDVLKVPHHGSRYSVSEEFYYEKKIGAAVISVGYNLYGHPSREVIDVLETNEIPYFRTDEAGCVELLIGDDGYKIDYYFS